MPAGEAAEWHCGNCGGLNVDEDTACANCGASRPVEPFVARPRIDEADESDQRLLSWIARATLLVGATAAVYTAIALRGDCGNGQVGTTCNFNDWVNQSQGWLWYALLALVIPTQISALAFAVLYRRRRRARLNRNNVRIRLGRILGIVGGFVALVGVFLPWATVGTQEVTGGDSIAVFALGILGLEFVAIPTRGTATMGVVWGIIALLATLVNIPALGSLGITYGSGQVAFDFGFYVTILGSLVLIVGSSACALGGEEGRTLATKPAVEPPRSIP